RLLERELRDAVTRLRLDREVDLGERGGRWPREIALQSVEPALSPLPRGIRGLGAVAQHGRDEGRGARAVIERHELGDEGERLPGDRYLCGRHGGQSLELTHRLPADEAHESPGERRVPGALRGAPAGVERID